LTTADLQQRTLERYRLSANDYRLSQLRYDLGKLRAKGLVERLGGSRRYRLTATGLRLGTVLTKVRFRLLGPLTSLACGAVRARSHHPSPVEAALRDVGTALDRLCEILNLKAA
jgi:DNA-binding transcriptional ArsR family regulator